MCPSQSLYFNPRARVGRDNSPVCDVAADGISIHAPAWGATSFWRSSSYIIQISIHAPAWGATISSPISGKRFCNFNPRARVGRDSPICLPTFCGRHFNPRARVGRDEPTAARLFTRQHFNPRARVGRDAGSAHQCGWQNIFQSTRPRGARLFSDGSNVAVKDFNPRARVGRDGCWRSSLYYQMISIHAPAWGATENVPWLVDYYKFQSTRPRGARQTIIALSAVYQLFQSTRPRGARRHRVRRSLPSANFNPRARVGRDDEDGNIMPKAM